MKNHYVYRITNKENNKHYYGVRSSKIEPKLDLGIKYFSSSRDKEFMNEQKINKDKFKYKVIKMFETREEAINLEIKLHNKFEVQKNKNFYNKSKQTTTKFDTAGLSLYKDETNNIILITPDEAKQRGLKGIMFGSKASLDTLEKLKKSKKGRTLSQEHKNKISEAHKGKPKSEETKFKLRKANLGKTASVEAKAKMSKSNKGKPKSEEHNKKVSLAKTGKKHKIVQCPHCDKEGGQANMTRWHFNNCKYKTIIHV